MLRWDDWTSSNKRQEVILYFCPYSRHDIFTFLSQETLKKMDRRPVRKGTWCFRSAFITYTDILRGSSSRCLYTIDEVPLKSYRLLDFIDTIDHHLASKGKYVNLLTLM